MKKVKLGKTGWLIHPLVYGSLPLGPLQAALSPADGGRLIRHGLEHGINMIDTAELYQNYSAIACALEGFSGTVHIATKTHAQDPLAARQHVERALKELGREQIDLVHLHAARVPEPFRDRAAVFDELLKLRDEGKIAFLGLSSHYISAIRQAAAHPEIDVIHPLLNRTGMGILDGSAQEMVEVTSAAARAGKGVYVMKALAGGNLIGQARDSLQWVLAQPGVQAAAVGMLSIDEIDANIALFAGESLSDDLWLQLESRRRRLRVMDRFCNGCGACAAACDGSALRVVEGKARVSDNECVLCGYCAAACPEFIIRVI